MNTEQHSKAAFYLETKKYNHGIEFIKSLLQEYPNDDQLHGFLSLYYQGLRDLNKSQKSIEVAIQLNPLESKYFKIAGRITLLLKKIDEAKSHLDKALELDPNDTDLYGLLGIVYISILKFDKAIEFANKGLNIDAQNKECLKAKSLALSYLKKNDAANEAANSLLRNDPINPLNLFVKGLVSLSNDDSSSKELFQSALSKQPYNDNIQSAYRISLRKELPAFNKLTGWIDNPDKKDNFRTLFAIGNSLVIFVVIGFYIYHKMNPDNDEWWYWPYLIHWNMNIMFQLFMFLAPPFYDAMLYIKNPKARHLYDTRLRLKTVVTTSLLALSIFYGIYFVYSMSLDSYSMAVHIAALMPLTIKSLYSVHLDIPERWTYFLLGIIIWVLSLFIFGNSIYFFIVSNVGFRVFSVMALRFDKVSKFI